MWLTAPNRMGVAAWQTDQAIWPVHAKGGMEGLQIRFGHSNVALLSSTDQPLPVVEEQFVRGDELHLSFPQPESDSSVAGSDDATQQGTDFGFRVVIRPIEEFESTSQRALFELLISIQTTFLDTYPTLDLALTGSSIDSPNDLVCEGGRIRLFENATDRSALILGPHDAPYTKEIEFSDDSDSRSDSVRSRLFGEFLEKGVIRRARPWLLLDRGDQSFSSKTLSDAWQALLNSPVPLD